MFMLNNRHRILMAQIKEEAIQPTNYLTFQSSSSFTLNVYNATKNWNGTLYYSTDKTKWLTWEGDTTLSSVNNKIYLAGSGNLGITGKMNDYTQKYRWVLTGSNIECIGNIYSLFDWEKVASSSFISTRPNSCSYLFHGCTSLIKAPSLPETTLNSGCYLSMFYGCTNLKTVPNLPATSLNTSCYDSMFSQCASFKVSTTKTGTYQYAWRIPTSGAGTTDYYWNSYMLSGTGGTFKSNPTINTTYYVENPPV